MFGIYLPLFENMSFHDLESRAMDLVLLARRLSLSRNLLKFLAGAP
jgi:hypothetical protein